MLNQSKVVGFLATSNPAAARQFYEHALGLKFVSEDGFAVVFDANGTLLRIQKVKKFTPPEHTALGWRVADIKAEVAALVRNGVACNRYPGMSQDEQGVWTSPSGAKIAWFKDPEGNILSLTQFD